MFIKIKNTHTWYWRQGKYTDQLKRIEFEERDIS